MKRNTIILEASSFTSYTDAIQILPSCSATQFYDVFKIVWKYKFETSGFDYNDKLIFKIGDERICTLQADSLSSLSSVACVSNANICIDKDCPKVNLGEGLKLYLLGTPPTQGDGEVVIETYYYLDDINKIWDN
jgi:hypothetical protein